MALILPDCTNSVTLLYEQLWAKQLQTALKLLSSRQQCEHGRRLNDMLQVTGAAYSIRLIRDFFFTYIRIGNQRHAAFGGSARSGDF